jgi:hypothetical protein
MPKKREKRQLPPWVFYPLGFYAEWGVLSIRIRVNSETKTDMAGSEITR